MLIYKYEHKNFLGRVKTLIITKFQNPDFHNKNADFCFVHLLIQNINKYQSNYFERSPRSYMGVILKTIIFSQKLPLPSSSLADEMVKMSLNWQVGILKSVIWGLYWVLSIRIHFSPLVTLEMRLFCTLPYNEIKYDQIIYIYLFVTQFN